MISYVHAPGDGCRDHVLHPPTYYDVRQFQPSEAPRPRQHSPIALLLLFLLLEWPGFV